MQSKGVIELEKKLVFKVRKLGLGFEGGVRKMKYKKSKRRVKEKSKKRSFGESKREGLSLFHAFAMENGRWW